MDRSDYISPKERTSRAEGFSPHYRGARRISECGESSTEKLQYRTTFLLRWTRDRVRDVASRLSLWTRCAMALVQTRFDLCVAGYEHSLRMINRTGRNSSHSLAIDEAMELCRVVNGVGRRVNAKCLERSLAARRMLLARGVDAALRIGVRRDEAGEFCAHAWLEYNDVVINDIAQVTRQFQTIHDPGVSVH